MKIFIVLILILFTSSCIEVDCNTKRFNINESLYVKGISIQPGGKSSSSRWLYHIGTITRRDTIFTIVGKSIQGSVEEDTEFKLGDKISIKKLNKNEK